VLHSIISPGVRVHSGAEISDSILMDEVEVGRNCRIKRAIIDKRVQIPAGTEIGCDLEKDSRLFKVTDNGIVVIPSDYCFE
jgi:glucose-1-phosphate adenylyltransferase